MGALETLANFFPFKKSPKPGYVLNSGAYYIREYTVYLLKEYIEWGVWRVAVCPSYTYIGRTVPKG
jgi:hypothetical protein